MDDSWRLLYISKQFPSRLLEQSEKCMLPRVRTRLRKTHCNRIWIFPAGVGCDRIIYFDWLIGYLGHPIRNILGAARENNRLGEPYLEAWLGQLRVLRMDWSKSGLSLLIFRLQRSWVLHRPSPLQTVFRWGFGAVPVFACIRCASFGSFLPPALS